jgi:hypothetical protein
MRLFLRSVVTAGVMGMATTMSHAAQESAVATAEQQRHETVLRQLRQQRDLVQGERFSRIRSCGADTACLQMAEDHYASRMNELYTARVRENFRYRNAVADPAPADVRP